MGTDQLPQTQEQQAAYTSQRHAAGKTSAHSSADRTMVIQGFSFGYGRHQEDRHGVCDGAREKNQRESHAGKNTVDAESICCGMSVNLEFCRNAGCLDGLKEIDAEAVGTKRDSKAEYLSGDRKQA